MRESESVRAAWDEFRQATDPLADSDADGIQDGEETIAGTDGFVTNPLLADSDGDGIRDGLEIQTSTDPTDPASFDLAAALQSIEVVPATFVLMVNFISPQTSRQLSVVGTMLDGATIDLTSTGKGTNYTSSNLTICNFGATDGEVFPGSIPGNCTISVTNNGFAAQAPGAVVLFFPLTLSVIPIPGFANGVDINGDFAYVAAGEAGLQIVDASDRRDPQIVGSLDTPGNANDVKVVGTTVYVADGSEGLRIIDVSNPLSPATLGVADTTGDARMWWSAGRWRSSPTARAGCKFSTSATRARRAWWGRWPRLSTPRELSRSCQADRRGRGGRGAVSGKHSECHQYRGPGEPHNLEQHARGCRESGGFDCGDRSSVGSSHTTAVHLEPSAILSRNLQSRAQRCFC